jgi:MraZ protein
LKGGDDGMLMGEHAHTVDAKGRVILPAEFRADLGEHFVITRGLDTCLFVYGEEEWDKFSKKLMSLPTTNPEARAIVRYFLSGARQLECDRQGRFLIPSNLRQHAKLKKDVVLNGVINRIEVWSKDEWNTYNDSISSSVEQRAATRAGLGI